MIGRLIRHDNFIKNVIKGKEEGKHGRKTKKEIF